jgi:hypothetical protein
MDAELSLSVSGQRNFTMPRSIFALCGVTIHIEEELEDMVLML